MTDQTNTDEDRVWLMRASDINAGELISRVRLPENAERSRFVFDPTRLGAQDDRTYETWILYDVDSTDELGTPGID